MDSFEIVARFMTSAWGVSILCGVIGLWAIVAYARFRSRLAPYHREMARMCNLLTSFKDEEDLAARFSDLDEHAGATGVLGHQWAEFKDTLLDPAIDDERQVLYSSQPAGTFFSRDSLLGERINLRLFNALPNLLTGTGILGTFVGLVAGIYLAGASLANPETAQAALGDLLGGASLAFLTSIVGLLSSILFSSAEKHQLHGFEQRRQCWVNKLDERLRRVSVELLTRDGLSESRRQTELLGGFTEQLAFQLTEALERTVPKALEAQVAQPLTDALTKLQSSVDEMARNQSKTNEDTLREIVDRFSSSITGAAGEEMKEFGTTMKLMSTQLTKQIGAIAEQQASVRKQSEESVGQLAKVFQEGAEGLQERVAASVNEVLDGLSTTVTEMSALLDAAGGRMAEQLDATTAAFGSTVGTLNNSVEEIRHILTSANRLMEYTDQLVAATREAMGSADEVAKSLESSTQEIRSAALLGQDSASNLSKSGQVLVDAMATFQSSQERVEGVWNEYQQRFQNVDEALGKTFAEIDTGLQGYSHNIRDFVRELDQHTGKITASLAGAVEELNGGIEDLAVTFGRRAA